MPDATTLLNFRHRLETHDLCKRLFRAINADLTARGLWLREGTLVDATLIAAPPSTKNKEKQRDPERHQTKKGNPWYFGMKAHIGADRDSKLVHTVVVTAVNVADITKTAERLHGAEQQVHADAGYTGVEKRAEIVAMEPEDRLADRGQTRGHQSPGRRGRERSDPGRGESQSLGASVCGTSVSHHEEHFPASESQVSRPGQERASTLHALWTSQRDDRQQNRHELTNP